MNEDLHTHVGPYLKGEQIGGGGFAQVFRSYDAESGRDIALKVVALVNKTSEKVALAEEYGAKLQKKLNQAHPKIAAVYHTGTDRQRKSFYVCMELVRGEDLSEILRREGPLPETRAVAITQQLCDILERVHAFSGNVDGQPKSGVVHGDLEPQNVRLEAGDQVRVFDFGIATALSETRNFTKEVGRTPLYLSPERVEHGTMDRDSDIWSIGVILYEMLQGHPPFQGLSEKEIENKILHGRPASLPDCSPRLQEILRTVLNRDLSRRYRSAAEFKAALTGLQQGTAGRSGVSGSSAPPVPGPGVTVRTPGPAISQASRPRPPAPAPAPAAPLAPSAIRRPVSALVRMTRSLGRVRKSALLAILAVYLVVQSFVWHRAGQIGDAIHSAGRPDLLALAETYGDLQLPALPDLIALYPARGPLMGALTDAGDRIIAEYHLDQPDSQKSDWQQARAYYQAAYEIDDSPEILARVLYCEAHLLRWERLEYRRQGRTAEGERVLDDAIALFERAASLDPEWRDPFLGLARVFAYTRVDLEELQKAIEAGVARGHPRGKREVAQLADGHRMRCQDLYDEALRGSGSRRGQTLIEARSHCRESIGLYGEIEGFARAEENRRRADSILRKIDDRL